MSDYMGTDNLEVMEDAVNYNRFLLSLVKRYGERNRSILDFGAGIGTFANALAADGYRVHCVEPDAKQASMIAALCLPVSENTAQIDDASIDFLYSFNVLEHIQNDVEALRECYRVVKPGGKILIYVPAFQVLFSSMDYKVGHCRRYTRKEVVRKLGFVGFKIRRACYADCLGFFASLAFRLMGSDTGTVNRRALIFFDRIIFPVSRVLDIFCAHFFGKNVLVVATK